MKKHALALHIFRRDLRLEDNTALINALSTAEKVIPCFIFDPRQIEKNDYKSQNCIQFMVHSLLELDEQLRQKGSRLYFFYGHAEEVITQLLKAHAIDAVFINRDYTPFSLARDMQIKSTCEQLNVTFSCHGDALLLEPEQVKKIDLKPYTIFTPFYHKAMSLPIRSPDKNTHDNYYQGKMTGVNKHLIKKLALDKNEHLLVKGGRKEAQSLLRKLTALTDYNHTRDLPYLIGTTHLSAHHKFGTLSIREVYSKIANTFGEQHSLIKELYWRDFFTHIAWHFPRVFGHAFHDKYNHIKWSQSEIKFNAWCQGLTGFPIVDAGMRELNTTGYMHNRVRMITASFLTKDLHIDWRAGEKYFAQQLVDYDPAVNNGNWQWAASTGCDAQPYFRIFNPWLQQDKFDPDCLYIKKWIPELAEVSAKHIHQLAKNSKDMMCHYPLPIIDHAVESQKTKLLYAAL